MEIINLENKHFDKLQTLLMKEGFNQNQINVMLKDFTALDDKYDVYHYTKPLFHNEFYKDVLMHYYDIYKRTPRSSKVKDDQFIAILKSKNISISEAVSLRRYSFHSSFILSYKRQLDDKVSLKEKTLNNLEKLLCENKAVFALKDKIIDFVENIDYENDEPDEVSQRAERFYKSNHVPHKSTYDINGYINKMFELSKLDETISSIDKTLENQIPYNMILYRGIEDKYLNEIFFNNLTPEKNDYTSLIGKKLEENGYLSTSSIYDASFAIFPRKNVVFKIFVPKGSQGMNIMPFSNYENECEILLNSSDLYIFDVENDFIDKDFNKKIVLSCLLLSKDRECYKYIGAKNQENGHKNFDEENE